MMIANKINIGKIWTAFKMVYKFKYLGLWLNSSYTWQSHIESLKTKCKSNQWLEITGEQIGTH